ncbi:MAG TPA: SWIB/MDM2 domain-containing protein [Vicinamibacterales bacterium]|nr:SWIB/MDM2 domain-containing protein [Vicinamibacterales bacterium]
MAKSAKKATRTRKSPRKAARKTGARKAARRTTARAAGARKAARKTSGRTGRKAGARKSARRVNAAFMRPVTPSPALAAVVGDKPIPRTEVTKRLWDYIRRNGLQDATNRRQINADATLQPVFGGKSSVSMFEMTKLVNQHVS